MPQVDLFVNYDCDLQAANLFERLVRGLSRVVQQAPNPNGPMGGPGSAPQGAAGAVLASHLKPRDAAMGALLALIASLDGWAAPLQASVNSNYGSSAVVRETVLLMQSCWPSLPPWTAGLPLCRQAPFCLSWFVARVWWSERWCSVCSPVGPQCSCQAIQSRSATPWATSEGMTAHAAWLGAVRQDGERRKWVQVKLAET